MFEIDKENFGSFLAQLRKEKGYTQKELAGQLLVSDKAVSKWETGKSMPDITLLVPLSELLGVTVTELLEGRRIEETAQMDAVQVEELVQKTLSLTEELPRQSRQQMKRHGLIWAAASFLALMEMAILYLLFEDFFHVQTSLITTQGLCIVFGAYFWIFSKERLPRFYDENKISFYSDGLFRMNMAGIRFNNRNWPHLMRTCRLSLTVCSLTSPLLAAALYLLLPEHQEMAGQMITLFYFLGLFFLPLIVVGKKYE